MDVTEMSHVWCLLCNLSGERLTLAIWKELLVLGACVHDPFQLQLAQLALLNSLLRKAVPQRIGALWEGDSTTKAQTAQLHTLCIGCMQADCVMSMEVRTPGSGSAVEASDPGPDDNANANMQLASACRSLQEALVWQGIQNHGRKHRSCADENKAPEAGCFSDSSRVSTTSGDAPASIL